MISISHWGLFEIDLITNDMWAVALMSGLFPFQEKIDAKGSKHLIDEHDRDIEGRSAMIPVSDKELFRRIKEKLDKHDKSLFTQGELNFLRRVMEDYMNKTGGLQGYTDNEDRNHGRSS